VGVTGLDAAAPEGVEWHWARVEANTLTDARCPGAVPLPFLGAHRPRYTPCASARSEGSPVDEYGPSSG